MTLVLAVPLNQDVAYVAAVPPLAANGAVSAAAWVYVKRTAPADRAAVLTLESPLPGVPALTIEINAGEAGSVAFTRGAADGQPGGALLRASATHALGGGDALRSRGWHHVAVTYSGGTLTSDVVLYVDGVRVESSGPGEANMGPAGSVAGNGNVRIGSAGGGRYLHGAVRDVGVWQNRVLTDAEVAALAGRTATVGGSGMGAGLVFGPSFQTNTVDPVSGASGVVSGFVSPDLAVVPTATPPVLAGLIAYYDVTRGVTLSGSNVSAWADSSGGGNNLAQSNAAIRPLWLQATATTGAMVSFVPASTFGADADALDLPAAAVNADLSPGRFSVFFVGTTRIPAGTGVGSQERVAQTYFSTPQFALTVGSVGTDPTRDGDLGYVGTGGGPFAASFTPSLKGPSSVSVLSWRATGPTTVNIGRQAQAVAVARGAPAATPAAQPWRLGAQTGPSPQGLAGNFAAVLLYNRDLSDEETARVREHLSATFSATQEPQRVVVLEGSSSAAGFNATRNQDLLWRSKVLRSDLIFNFARGGDDCTGLGGSDINVQAPGTVDRAVVPGKQNFLVVWIGSNDLNARPNDALTGVTDQSRAQHVYGRLVQYCSNRRAAGYTRIAVATVLSRDVGSSTVGQASFENRRAIFNGLIRQGVGTGYDAVIDFAAHPQMGVNQAYFSSPLLFSADRIHPSDAGFALLAPIFDRFLSVPKPRVPRAVVPLTR